MFGAMEKNGMAAWGRGFLAVVVLALLAGCASRPPAPGSAATPDYNYIIGPGDTVNIIVWRNPELSMSVPVRPDGKITTPLVEDLPAMGKDSSTLAREIEKVLSKYIRDPVVTVIVGGFVGPYSEQIRVLGEVGGGGGGGVAGGGGGGGGRGGGTALPYKQKMTLLDVMIAVGGLSDFADGNRAYIVRAVDQGKQYGVRLNDLMKRGDISANVEMRPGDILIIPQSWF